MLIMSVYMYELAVDGGRKQVSLDLPRAFSAPIIFYNIFYLTEAIHFLCLGSTSCPIRQTLNTASRRYVP